jgi:hypothetical protein
MITSFLEPSNPSGLFGDLVLSDASRQQELLVWGPQIEALPYMSSYVFSNTDRERDSDKFSLVTSNNFNEGFSLLLDSETTTNDFLYRIKAGPVDARKVISELKNNGGTLEWVVNDTSAQSEGLYPQVGFVNGRVRTVSSYGPANGTIQNNYLYTTGLSFPTPAVVAPGADELEFGVPQTLKAVYVWNGQLSDTEAVSVIKGEYNVVPNLPIGTDTYSFVYNTDPTDIGETSISIPYIVPTLSMVVDWGDGQQDSYSKGVLPQHTYPYPGQYRIQITADDGLEAARLSDVSSTITKVDQWSPQFRVGQTPGYTGGQFAYMLVNQYACRDIPPFAYTDLTDISYCYAGCRVAECNDWDFVPYELQSCTSVAGAFFSLSSYSAVTADQKISFPQLQTTSALTSVSSCFYYSQNIQGFKKDGVTKSTAFTDTSEVTSWDGCFAYSGINSGFNDYDYSSGVDFDATWRECGITGAFPLISLPRGQKFVGTWRDNPSMTSFPAIDFRSPTQPTGAYDFTVCWGDCTGMTTFGDCQFRDVVDINSAWYNCTSLTTFPSTIALDKCVNAPSAWQSCRELTALPDLDMPVVKSLSYTFYGMLKLNAFPSITNTSNCYNWNYTFVNCPKPTSVDSALDVSGGTQFIQCWYACSGLTSFPELDFSNAKDLSAAWSTCTNMTSFPSLPAGKMPTLNEKIRNAWAGTAISGMPVFSYDSLKDANSAWLNCSSLVTFEPNQFDTTGELIADAFDYTWRGCALSAGSTQSIMISLKTNAAKGVNTSVILDISEGTNTPRYTGSSGTTLSWTAATESTFNDLLAIGWTIKYNKYAGVVDTLPVVYYVFHDENNLHFVESKATVESGLANKEVFDGESAAVARVLEMDKNYFPKWNRNEPYYTGDRVKFAGRIFRALKDTNPTDFQLADITRVELGLVSAEAPSPMNRTAKWAEIYDYEQESFRGPIQRTTQPCD